MQEPDTVIREVSKLRTTLFLQPPTTHTPLPVAGCRHTIISTQSSNGFSYKEINFYPAQPLGPLASHQSAWHCKGGAQYGKVPNLSRHAWRASLYLWRGTSQRSQICLLQAITFRFAFYRHGYHQTGSCQTPLQWPSCCQETVHQQKREYLVPAI